MMGERKAPQLSYRPQGEPNQYVLMLDEKDWLMTVQLNGELSTHRQREIVESVTGHLQDIINRGMTITTTTTRSYYE